MIDNDGKGTSLDRLHKGNLAEEVTSELNIASAGEKKLREEHSKQEKLPGQRPCQGSRQLGVPRHRKKANVLEPCRRQQDGLQLEGRQRPGHGGVFKI